jgi:DNA-binding NtrC family response regulator
MRRRLFIASLAALIFSRAVDLGACGDKFLRAGRSARFRRYGAAYPVAILIYSPVNSTRKGINELQALLKRAGHKAVALDRGASVSAALAASPYDLLIADYQDAERLKADLKSAASHAALLPILNTPDGDLETAARRQFAFLIRPHAMTKYDALAEIDRLMESRSRVAVALK